jgi:hypothetical protein
MHRLTQLRSLITIAALSFILTLAPTSAPTQTPKPSRTPVVVELFTSEGCSSCPPADALLAKLDHDQPVLTAEIIVLGEHVDYWDELGWHDRFSAHQFTDRQSQYASRFHAEDVYTPQMIVDGTDQFVGNDSTHALQAIQHASRTPKFPLALSHPIVDGHRISASVSTAAPPAQLQGDLYAALVDPKDSTDVRRGENSGHRLQHAGVVRTMQHIGSLKDLSSKTYEFSLTAPPDATPATMRVVVFAQRAGQGPVLGAVCAPVTP